MGMPVVSNAVLACSFGVAPTPMMVLPEKRVLVENMPAANIMDNKPFVNILPFGMCSSLANPAVAAATAAALGVLTPMPCTPATTAPWVPGSPTVLVGNMPALNNSSQCICSFGGVITVSFPGATRTMVP